jgi:hypothetical protein
MKKSEFYRIFFFFFLDLYQILKEMVKIKN